jgi:hypothetical protein
MYFNDHSLLFSNNIFIIIVFTDDFFIEATLDLDSFLLETLSVGIISELLSIF